MNAKRFAFLVIALMLAAASSGSALALEAKVTPVDPPEFAEIGQDLVLVFDLDWTAETSLDKTTLRIEATSPGGEAFYGAAYNPVVRTTSAGFATVEWAAPIDPGTLPQEQEIEFKITAQDKKGAALSGAWAGSIKVDFGKEWTAEKIAYNLEEKGLLPFLLLVFGFGLVMSLSPCIYPMIPITLSVIGAQSQEKGLLHGFIMSLTYVVGMAMVYAIIGYLSATVASGLIADMQSAWVMVPVAIILLVLSFSMFGAYELQAPQFMRDRLGNKGSGSSFLGVFIVGMVAGLIASPCVGPFLGALLLFLATTGNGILAFFCLFIFGIGMGMLLIAVGTFPALMGKLPQAGGWMETMNRGMGLILVGMALFFIRPFIPAPYFYPILSFVMVLVSVFMGAFEALEAGAGWWDRTRKTMGILVFVMGLMILLSGLIQHGFVGKAWRGMIADAMPQTVTVAAGEARVSSVGGGTEQATAEPVKAPLPAKVQWEIIKTGNNVSSFFEQKRAEAKAAGKPIIIDFWATWCVYCKKLDKEVWNQPEVVEESLRFVTIKVDATKADDAEMTALKEEMKVPGLPRVIFIDSRGEILHGRTSAFKPAAEMLEVMKSIR